MAFLNSDNIRVFPSTRRTFQSSHSRQVTEANLVSLVNKLIDVDSFVITDSISNVEDEFNFNIHGYYFSINDIGDLTDLFNSSTDIYAVITIDKGTSDTPPEFYELDGLDENNNYEGVNFVDSLPSLNSNQYALHILTKSGGDWSIPENSKFKFS